MTLYYCDPVEDVTVEEMHVILSLPPRDFWRKEDVPPGCERHFVAIDESMIPAKQAPVDVIGSEIAKR